MKNTILKVYTVFLSLFLTNSWFNTVAFAAAPNTGDNRGQSMGLVVGILIASVVLIVLLLVLGGKKGKKK